MACFLKIQTCRVWHVCEELTQDSFGMQCEIHGHFQIPLFVESISVSVFSIQVRKLCVLEYSGL